MREIEMFRTRSTIYTFLYALRRRANFLRRPKRHWNLALELKEWGSGDKFAEDLSKRPWRRRRRRSCEKKKKRIVFAHGPPKKETFILFFIAHIARLWWWARISRDLCAWAGMAFGTVTIRPYAWQVLFHSKIGQRFFPKPHRLRWLIGSDMRFLASCRDAVRLE